MSETTVIVGCKLPNGLVLELGKKGSQNYQTVTLNGSNAKGALIVPGTNYGVTSVPKAFMDKWMEKHSWLPAVKEKHIFVEEKVENASARALDDQASKTGLEPLDPAKPPKGIEVDKAHMQQSHRDLEERRQAAR
jgi:hypothetical protein